MNEFHPLSADCALFQRPFSFRSSFLPTFFPSYLFTFLLSFLPSFLLSSLGIWLSWFVVVRGCSSVLVLWWCGLVSPTPVFWFCVDVWYGLTCPSGSILGLCVVWSYPLQCIGSVVMSGLVYWLCGVSPAPVWWMWLCGGVSPAPVCWLCGVVIPAPVCWMSSLRCRMQRVAWANSR